MLILRLIHVTGGVFWAGTIFFIVLFLEPAARAAGPDAAKVMGGIQRRGLLTILPATALLTILTGVDLLRRASAGFQSEWFGSTAGMTYSTGMATSIVAFLLGFFVMRPATIEAGRLAGSLASLTDAAERAKAEASIQQLRGRSRVTAQVVAALLLVAVVTMAVGRYV